MAYDRYLNGDHYWIERMGSYWNERSRGFVNQFAAVRDGFNVAVLHKGEFEECKNWLNEFLKEA